MSNYNELETFKSRAVTHLSGELSKEDKNILEMIKNANENARCTTVTPLEMEVLQEIESCDLNDGTQDCFYGKIYHYLFDMKVIRGVISSLVKKGIVVDVEESVTHNYSCTEIVISDKFTGYDFENCFKIINVKVKK